MRIKNPTLRKVVDDDIKSYPEEICRT